jgi:succinyl-diaminopimelate desuccinylase
MFDRPSINLGRIEGGQAVNMVPDLCTMVVDVRFLPGQDADEIVAQVSEIEGVEIARTFIHPPVTVERSDPYVRALREAVASSTRGEVMSVGRDGASDAVAFIEAGIPAVEFGPAGGGHHGPEEWVSVSSLARYRKALADFVRSLPIWLEEDPGEARTRPDAPGGLKAIEGGLA